MTPIVSRISRTRLRSPRAALLVIATATLAWSDGFIVIPPDRPTHVYLTAGGDPPVAPATETLTFEPADPYAVEAERFAAAILDGAPLPTPPEDAVDNLRVIERLFGAVVE